MIKTEPRFMRSEEWTINGYTARKLITTQGTSVTFTDAVSPSFHPGLWGIRAWILHEDGSLAEITPGTPVAIVTRSALGAGLQSATWDCPQVSLVGTDAIRVWVYVKIEDYLDWTLTGRGRFVSEQLGASRLEASTWTVYYYTWIWYDELYKAYYYRYMFGTPTYNSRITNFKWGKPAASSGSIVPLMKGLGIL